MAAQQTIVVVEDEPAIAEAVAARLRSEGFDARLAADGPSGVALCEEARPDLVVLDLMLPGLDGVEVCRREPDGLGGANLSRARARELTAALEPCS